MKPAPGGHSAFVHEFPHGGRQYRLFKLLPSRDAAYYVHLQSQGRRFKKSLETNVKEVAIVRAKSFIEKVRGEKWAELTALKGAPTPVKSSSLGEIFTLYPTLTLIARRSVHNNILAMKQVVRASEPDAPPEELPLSRVNADLARQYQTAVVRRYAQEAGKNDESQREARERALRSSKSTIRQARALFNRHLDLPGLYGKAGVIIPPCVKEFTTCTVQGRETKREYHAPPDRVVRAAFDEIRTLKKSDPSAYLAFWFAVGAGLRRREIRDLRWEHVIERDGWTWVSGGSSPIRPAKRS